MKVQLSLFHYTNNPALQSCGRSRRTVPPLQSDVVYIVKYCKIIFWYLTSNPKGGYKWKVCKAPRYAYVILFKRLTYSEVCT